MMGQRGPRPTPTAILEQRGSRRAADRKNEPRPAAGAPRCPAWLDKEAKQVWKQIVPQLTDLGVLTKIDGNALARYCRLFVRWRKCDTFVQQYGETYPTKDKEGNITSFQQFPEVGIINRLSALLIKIEQEYGLTPSARTRIEVDVPAPAEPEGKARFFNVVKAG